MGAPVGRVRGGARRADMQSGRGPAMLRQAAGALVSQSSGQFGSLPAADQRKIADLIASDPIFSGKIFRYLDKRLV